MAILWSMPSHPPPPPPGHLLVIARSRRPLYNEDLFLVSTTIGPTWIRLGRRLLPGDPQLVEAELLSMRNELNERQCAYMMLQMWQQAGPSATVGNLALALISIGEKNIALRLLP